MPSVHFHWPGVVATAVLLLGCDGSESASGEFAELEGLGEWSPLPSSIDPEDEYEHGNLWAAAEWTGAQLLVWGGFNCVPDLVCGGGASYSLQTNEWREITNENAPSARAQPASVWTGTEMLIWGGWQPADSPDELKQGLGNGSAYDPTNDVWRSISDEGAPSARAQFQAAWTGTEMLVWGGSSDGGIIDRQLGDGAAYDPSLDAWREIQFDGAPSARSGHSATWTGGELLVWGGRGLDGEFLNSGAAYDPLNDTWRTLSTENAPDGRVRHSAVWTGRHLYILGGLGCTECETRYYDPVTDQWQEAGSGGPDFRETELAAVWSGTEILIWNGSETQQDARYDVASQSWSRITEVGAPARRSAAHTVWTGEQMLLWGGEAKFEFFFDGGLYTP